MSFSAKPKALSQKTIKSLINVSQYFFFFLMQIVKDLISCIFIQIGQDYRGLYVTLCEVVHLVALATLFFKIQT